MPIKYNKDLKALLFKYHELEVARDELLIANTELAFQNSEKEKRAAELVIANAELVFQNSEKEKRAAELVIANKELFFQNSEKEKRAAELVIANAELLFQNSEKEKRAAELVIANAELVFQNSEKEKRAAELAIANTELLFQSDETKKRVAEINNLAFYDSLTMLPNRRLLVDRLKRALVTSARAGHHGALLFLDIDHFKTLNDTHGHNAGNLLLQHVSHRLIACVREGDTVARLGGDEFVVILEALGTNKIAAASYARVIANKILDSLNLPCQLETLTYSCTSSIGVTLFSDAKVDLEALLQQADIAMYQAKKEGRNTLRFYDPQMQDAINARAALEEDLHVAIEEHQFELYYQIQVNDTGKPVGAEALIRWVHPEQGLISPMSFIPLSEETGLIIPIGQWVLEAACAQLAEWQQRPECRDLVLAVNVSAKQFSQADFVSQVQIAIKRFSINPLRLKLELTETMLLHDIDETIKTMDNLRGVGVQFALDDFGTGYSSLQYLKRLPFDQLKIDRSFVRDIEVDLHDKSIVRTIIAMANNMELNVIAEGVETSEQQKILLNKGCSTFQGFLYGKPEPLDKFESSLTMAAIL